MRGVTRLPEFSKCLAELGVRSRSVVDLYNYGDVNERFRQTVEVYYFGTCRFFVFVVVVTPMRISISFKSRNSFELGYHNIDTSLIWLTVS